MEDKTFTFSSEPSLEEIRKIQHDFAQERDWDQYHSPRNLLLALVGEVGELAEIFQWRGEVKEGLPDFSANEKEHVGQEISDIMLYLVRLAEKCHVNLPEAVMKKIQQNRNKYPASVVYGRSEKYTEYAHGTNISHEIADEPRKLDNGSNS